MKSSKRFFLKWNLRTFRVGRGSSAWLTIFIRTISDAWSGLTWAQLSTLIEHVSTERTNWWQLILSSVRWDEKKSDNFISILWLHLPYDKVWICDSQSHFFGNCCRMKKYIKEYKKNNQKRTTWCCHFALFLFSFQNPLWKYVICQHS